MSDLGIRIREDVYDVNDVLEGSSIGRLRTLKKLSGASVKTINEQFIWAAQEAQKGGFNGLQLLDSEEFLAAMQALIYLAKWRAGEQPSWDEAGEIAFKDFEFIPGDDGDDPKDGSGAADESAPGPELQLT